MSASVRLHAGLWTVFSGDQPVLACRSWAAAMQALSDAMLPAEPDPADTASEFWRNFENTLNDIIGDRRRESR
jgi:hypothetical protein